MDSPMDSPEAIPEPGFSRPKTRPTDPFNPESSTVGESDTAPDSDSVGATPQNGSTASTDSQAGKSNGPKIKRLSFDAETAAAFAEVAGAVIIAVSGLLNDRFAGEESPVWLADDRDIVAIGEPVGRIAARHAGLPGSGEITDITDAIQAGVGLAMYTLKNLKLRAQLRRQRRRAAQIQPDAPVDDVPTDQANPVAPLLNNVVAR